MLSAFRRPLHLSQRWSRLQNHPRHLSYSSVRHADHEVVKQSGTTADVKGKQKEVVDKTADKLSEDDELPFLSRPLGVKSVPSLLGGKKKWRERMMDQDVRMKERQQIVKEATKGYFTDLNATRHHGGKTWVAPRVLIREDKALYFPNLSGTDLKSRKVYTTELLKNKVTVLAILSSRISEIQTKMFTDPTNEAHSSNPLYQYVRVNLQENLLKSMLVSLFTNSIRKGIPEDQWGNYLVSNENMDYIREDIGFANKHVAYIYLIDPNCKIRWAGCADPKPQEIEALNVCTRVLLNRHTPGAT
ncbi:ATP10 protein-domain-containing protein [Cristinia sonorae]|uniref:ATP10 protein-domain-containing protein n=1 Tax=Cristinia sonorae TaxID=1940300 RepID=A0A8K0UUT0_9AGAR|nr:ATP10 protein-domain-containing protein [Cristinia sonorae]